MKITGHQTEGTEFLGYIKLLRGMPEKLDWKNGIKSNTWMVQNEKLYKCA
jgi:hypothetical protein